MENMTDRGPATDSVMDSAPISGRVRPIKQRKLSGMPWLWLGLFITLFGLGGALSWASLTEIHGAVIAQGAVAVQSKIKSIQHLEGGIVGEILVRSGDQVKAGDLLMRLDDESLKANLAITLSALDEFQAEAARLRAERDGARKIHFPKELLARSKAPELARVLKGQQALFEARRKALQGQQDILRQKIEALENQIRGSQAEQQAKEQQIALLDKEIESVSRLIEGQLATEPRLLSLQREKAQIEGQRGQLIAAIGRLRTDIEEVRLQIIQLNKDFRAKVLQRLREVQASIVEYSERKSALLDKLKRIDIRAPVAGRVHNLAIHTVGGVIAPAKQIMQIIPEDDSLIIEARIRTLDRDHVYVGQEAAVNLSALGKTVPTVMARVTNVASAPLTDPVTGQPYYPVDLALPEEELRKIGIDKQLVPGMPVEVFIRTHPRTPLAIMTKPLLESMRRALRDS